MKHVLITGCTRGLGRAMTAEFIRLGWTVAGCGRNAAALATLERLAENDGAVYQHLESLGALMEEGLSDIPSSQSYTVSRLGSAFCLYFMDHVPVDWHDLASHHDFAADTQFRKDLIDKGIYFFPLATKQCSISAAHTVADVEETVQHIQSVLSQAVPVGL